MNKVYEFLIYKYGYDEPVFLKELKEQLDMSDSAIYQNLERLTESEALIRVDNGIYYIPKRNYILDTPHVNLDKVVMRRYIKPDESDVIGFTAGVNFANRLGITSQTASIATIVTNKANKTEFQKIGGKRLIIRGSKVKITSRNYKILQVLDLLNNYNRISEISLKSAVNILKQYLFDVKISTSEFNSYIMEYHSEIFDHLIETGLYDEITRR